MFGNTVVALICVACSRCSVRVSLPRRAVQVTYNCDTATPGSRRSQQAAHCLLRKNMAKPSSQPEHRPQASATQIMERRSQKPLRATKERPQKALLRGALLRLFRQRPAACWRRHPPLHFAVCHHSLSVCEGTSAALEVAVAALGSCESLLRGEQHSTT